MASVTGRSHSNNKKALGYEDFRLARFVNLTGLSEGLSGVMGLRKICLVLNNHRI
jgi:hypothetical protein